MKKLLALLLALMLCFAFAACGEEEPAAEDPVAEEPAVTSIVGSWACIDAKMVDNGSEFDAAALSEMYGMKVKDMFALTAYGDGNGELTLYGADTAAITWSEIEGGYAIAFTDPEADTSETISAKLENEQLTVTIASTYDMDGTEASNEMIFVMEYLGQSSKLLANWDLQLTEEQSLAMNNFMAKGWFVVADGNLYGTFGGAEYGQGTFSMAKANGASLGDATTIESEGMATYLTEYEGYVYGILGNAKIVKIKAGDTKAETIYEGACDYLQIVDGKIRFCDENYIYCAIDLDGKNKEVVLEREIYFPYVLPNNVMVYQNDPDNESLYLYDFTTGDDVKIAEGPAYYPVFNGDYMYFLTWVDETEGYKLNRVDLYSGAVDDSGYDNQDLGMFFEGDQIYYALGGLPGLAVEKWNAIGSEGFGGFTYVPRYSNGEVRLYSATDGECFITTDLFNVREDSASIGYMYVAQ